MEKSDLVTILSKGVLGAIPFVGPLAAEIIGATIPNQRIDRIESFLKIFESKLHEIDKNSIEEKITSPEHVDLLEDSFIQATRALSEERKDFIASLMKNSLTDENLEYIEYKRLLSTLGELNDFEIIILKSYSLDQCTQEYKDFMEIHEDSLRTPIIYMDASIEDVNKEAIFQALLDDKLDIIATDHAPHTISEKDNKYLKAPSGLPLVQHALYVMLDFYKKGMISLERIVDKMCHAPARCFNVEKRGFLDEGYWADIVILDLEGETKITKDNILYKCGWSPLENMSFKGEITHTIVNGNVVYHDGQIIEGTTGKRVLFNP